MGRINAFRVIERLERINIRGSQNSESVKTNDVINRIKNVDSVIDEKIENARNDLKTIN